MLLWPLRIIIILSRCLLPKRSNTKPVFSVSTRLQTCLLLLLPVVVANSKFLFRLQPKLHACSWRVRVLAWPTRRSVACAFARWGSRASCFWIRILQVLYALRPIRPRANRIRVLIETRARTAARFSGRLGVQTFMHVHAWKRFPLFISNLHKTKLIRTLVLVRSAGPQTKRTQHVCNKPAPSQSLRLNVLIYQVWALQVAFF